MITTRFGSCGGAADVVLEGYAAADGRAHGRLDIIVDACDACAEAHKSGPLAGLTVHARGARGGPAERVCGAALVFAEFGAAAEGGRDDAAPVLGLTDADLRELEDDYERALEDDRERDLGDVDQGAPVAEGEGQGCSLSASPSADIRPAAVPAAVAAYAITRGASGRLWTRGAVMGLRQEPGGAWVAEVDGREVARNADLDRLVCELAASSASAACTAETLPLPSPILVRSPGERAPQRRPSAAA